MALVGMEVKILLRIKENSNTNWSLFFMEDYALKEEVVLVSKNQQIETGIGFG